MGDEEEMNLHPEAEKLRNDINKVISSFSEIRLCNVVDNFSDYLKLKNKSCAFPTLYKYLTETTPPAWLMPELCDFLTQEPYIKHQRVWEFIREYGDPIAEARDKVKAAAFTAKSEALARAGQYDEFL